MKTVRTIDVRMEEFANAGVLTLSSVFVVRGSRVHSAKVSLAVNRAASLYTTTTVVFISANPLSLSLSA